MKLDLQLINEKKNKKKVSPNYIQTEKRKMVNISGGCDVGVEEAGTYIGKFKYMI